MMELLQGLLYSPDNPLFFNSGFFLGFFVVVMLFYPLVVKNFKVRTWYLLIFSLYFYYKTGGLYVILLVVTSAVNFYLGAGIFKAETKAKKRWLMILSVIWNLGSLGYFKYTNFIIDTINQLGGNLPLFDIFLPVGISFFTFQTMSYTLDIYFGNLQPLHSFADFCFFVSFFPQLVAGPIVRASWFIPQINKKLSLNKDQIASALVLIIAGLIKKGVIADYISINFVDRVFDAPELFSPLENLLGVYGYGLQIYCDFSGYSDIAIGLATLMGFNLPVNFRVPYIATSITDFWRRWHISLSTWLRDYLYIPLGGNRKGKVRQYINLMITMVLGGLWHGASWNFVIWGTLHGVALAIDKLRITFMGKREHPPVANALIKVLGWLITFNFVSFTWIFFRARGLAAATLMIQRIFSPMSLDILSQWIQGYPVVAFLIAFGYLIHFIPQKWDKGYEIVLRRSPLILQSLILAVVIWILFQAKSADIQPFIYFQF
ncbi:MAG TPA: MBOAT family protein [Candidatus Cloacimonadota bacterium]|nr:MBOAT family protein [Candidatus Cloacimonadota bacterium]